MGQWGFKAFFRVFQCSTVPGSCTKICLLGICGFQGSVSFLPLLYRYLRKKLTDPSKMQVLEGLLVFYVNSSKNE